MVIHARALLFGAAVLSAALAGSTCKVVNEDHCANQDVPGNEWCRELNVATPYCSPCRREYHGCVDYEPYACEGYDNEIGEDPVDDDGPEESSSEGEPGSTGEAEAEASTDEAGSGSTGSSASSTDGSGSGTTGSSS